MTLLTTMENDPVVAAETRMKGAGFSLPSAPPDSCLNGLEDGMPDLPEDPTLLPDEEIMRLFFAFTEWTSYAESALWVAQSDEGVLEAKASRRRGDAITKASGARTVTEQKTVAASDPGVIKVEDELYVQRCVRRGMETVLRRCERNASAMSRELSRRGNRATTDHRAAKWGT